MKIAAMVRDPSSLFMYSSCPSTRFRSRVREIGNLAAPFYDIPRRIDDRSPHIIQIVVHAQVPISPGLSAAPDSFGL